MSDEARLEKKQRVEENRERRMQDAMGRGADQQHEPSPMRERDRVKSESRDDSNQGGLTVKEYVMQNEDLYKRMSAVATAHSSVLSSSLPAMLDNSLSAAAAPSSVSSVPAAPSAPSQPSQQPPPPQPQSVSVVPACNSHSFMDSVPTTAAHSLADVSSTTSNLHTMDVDPSTTMSSNGFIPPTIDAVPGLIPVTVTNAVESSLMAQAQAQLAAAQVQVQVQAAINHQQQQIAAVVAHQVAAQIGVAPPSAPIPPTLTQTLPSTLPPPILTTPMAAPSAATMLHHHHALTQPPLVASDMVTIPRDVLVKLIENNTMRAANCTCTCMCGRYPPGAVIVDEVTKDLISAGGQTNNTSNTNCSSCENKDEARLETAEDFQMNGLLPSDDSSVQWLNSSQPTVVDPSAFPDANPPFPVAMDTHPAPFYPNQTILESQMQSVSVDPDIALLTPADRDFLCELEAASQSWNAADTADKYSSSNYNRDTSSVGGSSSRPGHSPISIESSLRGLLNVARRLPAFRSLNHLDQMALIKNRALPSLIIRAAQLFDPKETDWKSSEAWPFGQDILQQCTRLYGCLSEEVRSNESIVSVLSLLALLDPDAEVRERATVAAQREQLAALLKRLLFSQRQDASRARSEFRCLMALLPAARDVSSGGGDWDPRRVEAILLEMC